MTQVDRGAGEAPSDAELILQVRSGDREAFGTLYTRHAPAARALARQYVRPGDAEDVVADAFGKLYELLRRGDGPDSGFRTYLYTVVRHRAYDVSRGASRMRPAEDAEIEAALGKVTSPEDPALQGFERSVVSRAYFSLPERWREVLWYCLVDDLKPAQVAPVLGLTPNGVSALLYRAKDALRDGYLQQHLTHAPTDTCRAVNPHLGGYVRDSLSRREKARIEEHLSGCATCSALVLELSDVAHGMKCVVAPLVLGAAGLALVGSAIPVGAGLAAAVKAVSAAGGAAAGSSGAAAGSTAVGTTTSTAAGTSAVAGSSTAAGASTAAGTSAAAGSTAVAGSATAAGAGTTVTVGSTAGAAATAGASATGTAAGVAGATASMTAAGVVGAGGAAATSGAMAAGAITVATVGVVAALQIMGSNADPEPEVPTSAVAATAEAPATPGPTTAGNPSVPPETDSGEPANLLPAMEDVELSFTRADTPLEPRRAQNLVLVLENQGEARITGATVHLTLPDGMVMAAQDSPSGTSYGGPIAADKASDDVSSDAEETGEGDAAADDSDTPSGGTDDDGTGGEAPSDTRSPSAGDTGTSAGDDREPRTGGGGSTASDAPSKDGDEPVRTLCTPGSEAGEVLCDVGVLSAGEVHEVQVTVRVRSGGSYPIDAELRADDIGATPIDLPAREAESFGPELTAQAEASKLMAPGRGTLALRVGNTGDLDAASGWSVAVKLPDGVRPAVEQDVLTCTGIESQTWSCRTGEASRIDPGRWRDLPLAVVAVPQGADGSEQAVGTAKVTPAGASHAQDARAQVTVTSAWTDAARGAGELTTQCVEHGGVDEARAEVVGTYTNTTPGKVLVALEAADDTVAHTRSLAPGESVTLRQDEGIRVPEGSATWVLSRIVQDTTYEHRVPAGELSAEECYDPDWEATAQADTVNTDGRVGVRGTLANATGEPMSATMIVPTESGRLVSEAKTVPPGSRETFTVATTGARLAAGSVTFQLARWTVDEDGDPPSAPARPDAGPTASYGPAVIAPSYRGRTMMSTTCAYDTERGASVGTFRVPVDNTGSTLPVTFQLGGTKLTVAAGESGTVVSRVLWGTGKLPLLAGTEILAEIDVAFSSCADIGWPDDSIEAVVDMQCADGGSQVVANVRNTGGVAWNGELVGRQTGDHSEAEVAAGGVATLSLSGATHWLHDSQVLLRLSREFEGAVRTVERTYDVTPAACESSARCADGSDAPGWLAALFGRSCAEEPGDRYDEQATLTRPGFWGRDGA